MTSKIVIGYDYYRGISINSTTDEYIPSMHCYSHYTISIDCIEATTSKHLHN